MNVRRLLVRCSGFWVASALLLQAAAGGAEDPGPYPEGQWLQIKGLVTDAAGARPGLTVVLEAYRHASGLSSLNPRARGEKKGFVQRTTVTAADGSYALQWSWHDYYNRFELAVGSFESGGFEAIERIDLSQRMLQGSPVIVSFVLGETRAAAAPPPRRPESGSSSQAVSAAPPGVASADPYPAGLDAAREGSADQARVKNREGEPDLIDTLELPYGVEVTWWYFGRGRAYRFLDGELSEELPFDPVRSETR